MPGRKVDRAAWAAEVDRLVRDEAQGNKSAFARAVGVKTVKTIDRWLAGSVEVSERSVIEVCRALMLDPVPMMVKVGLLPDEQYLDLDISPRHLTAERARDEDAIAMIETSDVSPALKRQLIRHLRDQAREHERQRLADIERLLAIIAERDRTAG